MKLCAAFNQELPRENFSKKQWQLKQCRRCKECIASNREVNLEAADAMLLSPCADGKGASAFHSDEALFKLTPPRDECSICLLTLPLSAREWKYQTCCEKMLCRDVLMQLSLQIIAVSVLFAELLKQLWKRSLPRGWRNVQKFISRWEWGSATRFQQGNGALASGRRARVRPIVFQ